MHCAVTTVLYFEPKGTLHEVYKKNPDISITAYPFTGTARGSVIFIHGGGWQLGDSNLAFYSDWEAHLQKAGLRAFSIEHRTAPKFHGMDIINDCMDAVRYVKSNAARFNIPEDRFAIVGFSSGGHLAVMTGILLSQDSSDPVPISAVVGYYPPLELKLFYKTDNPRTKKIVSEFVPPEALKSEDDFNKALVRFSPTNYISEKMPPVYLIHGKKDYVVHYSQSTVFYRKSNSIRPGMTKLLLIEQAAHNFNIGRKPLTFQTEKKAVRFIEEKML